MQYLGATAKSVRATLGLSQADMAARLGVSVVQLSKLENNRAMPSQRLIKRYAEISNVFIRYPTKSKQWIGERIKWYTVLPIDCEWLENAFQWGEPPLDSEFGIYEKLKEMFSSRGVPLEVRKSFAGGIHYLTVPWIEKPTQVLDFISELKAWATRPENREKCKGETYTVENWKGRLDLSISKTGPSEEINVPL